MHNERDMEKEALLSIFPEEYEEISESKIRIKVKPDLLQEKGLEVSLVVTYLDDYPETSPEIDLLPGEGAKIKDDVLINIREFLQSEAKKRLGIPMIFELIELLRPELAFLSVEQSKGFFGLLSKEICMEIFLYSNITDLGRIMQASKQFFEMVSDEILWKYHVPKIYPKKKKLAQA